MEQQAGERDGSRPAPSGGPQAGARGWRAGLGRRLALSLASLLVFLGLTEAALRLAGYGPGDDRLRWTSHPDLQYLPAPDQRTWFGREDPASGETLLPIRINAYGQRGADYPLQPGPDEFRVVCLGDSLTFGPGVRDEQTYLAVLEQTLRREPSPVGGVRVVNAAVNGWATVHYRRWVETQLDVYRPDLLVVGLFIGNDMVIPTRGPIDVPVPLENLLRRSALGQFVHHAWRKRMWRRREQQGGTRSLEELDDQLARYAGIIESDLSFRDKIRLWEHAVLHLQAMAERAAEEDVPLVCLLIPTSWMTWQAEDVPIHPWLVRRLESAGIPVIVALDALRPVSLSAWLSFDEGHLSPRGHQAVARALREGLRGAGLLP